MRIGHSYDIHKLVPGRPLILGGVPIEFELGLLGHSDADVVLHVVAESILGALGLGDLGTHFSDTDDQNKDIDSKIIVSKVVELLSNSEYTIGNIDVIIYIEKPNLKMIKPIMRETVAKLLNTSLNNVNIKATTHEKLGPIGEGKAIAAEAVVLLKKDIR